MNQMKFLSYIFLFLFIVADKANGQKTAEISKNYDIEKMVGKWRGNGTWTRPNKPDTTISLEIELVPTSSKDTFQLTISYSIDKQVRHHVLFTKNRSKGEWLEDEKDSVLIPHQFVGNKLITFFKYGDNYSVISDWVGGNTWHREEYGFDYEPVYRTNDDFFRGYSILGRANFVLKKLK
jgi:hypothetical protein